MKLFLFFLVGFQSILFTSQQVQPLNYGSLSTAYPIINEPDAAGEVSTCYQNKKFTITLLSN